MTQKAKEYGRMVVFLDRDGTINVKAPEGEYITAPDQLTMLPGAAHAIRAFNDHQIPVVVVTNQRAVARGRMTMEDLEAVSEHLGSLLAEDEAHIDWAYVCVHEDGECNCRKPRPGLLLQAELEHPEIDMKMSIMIGDAESDVLAGRAAGTRTIRLGPPGTVTDADMLSSGLADAAARILSADRAPIFAGELSPRCGG